MLTSGDDSGGSGALSFVTDTSSGDESSDESVSEGFSTDVIDRARERAQESVGVILGAEDSSFLWLKMELDRRWECDVPTCSLGGSAVGSEGGECTQGDIHSGLGGLWGVHSDRA